MQGFHQLLKLFGRRSPLVVVATPARGHQVLFSMYINLKAAKVKAGLALRVIMIYLHLLILNSTAAIGTATAIFLVNSFPYRFAQSHDTPFFNIRLEQQNKGIRLLLRLIWIKNYYGIIF
jgi:hypothetical protein